MMKAIQNLVDVMIKMVEGKDRLYPSDTLSLLGYWSELRLELQLTIPNKDSITNMLFAFGAEHVMATEEVGVEGLLAVLTQLKDVFKTEENFYNGFKGKNLFSFIKENLTLDSKSLIYCYYSSIYEPDSVCHKKGLCFEDMCAYYAHKLSVLGSIEPEAELIFLDYVVRWQTQLLYAYSLNMAYPDQFDIDYVVGYMRGIQYVPHIDGVYNKAMKKLAGRLKESGKTSALLRANSLILPKFD